MPRTKPRISRLRAPWLAACLTGCWDPNAALEERVGALEARYTADESRVAAAEKHVDDLRFALYAIDLAAWITDPSGRPQPELAPSRPTSPQQANLPVAPGRCSGEGDRRVLPNPLPSAEEAAADARLVPHVTGGKEDGYRIFGIRHDSLASSCGLQNGDIVTSVQGVSLTSTAAALDAWRAAKDLPEFVVTVERRGAPVDITLVRGDDAR